jgi:hypothetical protein
MTGTEMKNVILCALVVVVVLFIVYQFNPTMFGMLSYEGFAEEKKEQKEQKEQKEHFADTKDAKKQGFADMVQGFKQKKQGFAEENKDPKDAKKQGFADMVQGFTHSDQKEGFADVAGYEGPAQFSSAQPPAGCYPRDQLTPSELLPKDMNSVWAEQNPMGPGSLKGKNFLSAGALIGVNTVGQSMRNANLQVRSEPPNPQVAVSIFNQTTISPDISHRPLEIGS